MHAQEEINDPSYSIERSFLNKPFGELSEIAGIYKCNCNILYSQRSVFYLIFFVRNISFSYFFI